MSRTMLTVGQWEEQEKIIFSAMSNQWIVVHTLLLEDIPVVLKKMHVDLILLSGCAARKDWGDAVADVWNICQDTPVVALGTDSIQDSLVNVLIGKPTIAHSIRLNLKNKAAGSYSFESTASTFRRQELSPTLTLLEPYTTISSGIKAALNYIDAHYMEPISLRDVAKAASYSYCHFSKIFKIQLGICFVSYLSQVRIRYAKKLLQGTDLSVTEIALEVGFNDLSHFERVFRTTQHQTPSKFRLKTKNMNGRAKNLQSIFLQTLTL
jgi:AraC-like DNA-binding protein